jgi:hypothetical protein
MLMVTKKLSKMETEENPFYHKELKATCCHFCLVFKINLKSKSAYSMDLLKKSASVLYIARG